MSLDTQLNCPSCRREHQIDRARDVLAVCSRCACELEILVSIRITAADQLAEAWQALRGEDYQEASQLVDNAWDLIATKEVAECGMITCVLRHDNAGISKWARRGR